MTNFYTVKVNFISSLWFSKSSDIYSEDHLSYKDTVYVRYWCEEVIGHTKRGHTCGEEVKRGQGRSQIYGIREVRCVSVDNISSSHL